MLLAAAAALGGKISAPVRENVAVTFGNANLPLSTQSVFPFSPTAGKQRGRENERAEKRRYTKAIVENRDFRD